MHSPSTHSCRHEKHAGCSAACEGNEGLWVGGSMPSPTGRVVISKECSLAMATSQPIANQQRSYEVFENKHDMECTTHV